MNPNPTDKDKCSGNKCGFYKYGDMVFFCHAESYQPAPVEKGQLCAPALKQQRDEARRIICVRETVNLHSGTLGESIRCTAEDIAKEKRWEYLYE